MGMEGKLRRISEFELAAYRKNPAKLYSDLFPAPATSLAQFTQMTSKMQQLQQSPTMQRIRERVSTGQQPLPEDVAEYKRELQQIVGNVPGLSEAMENQMPGLTNDKKQLSLHKSWSVLHYIFTGKGLEPDNSPLGQAILGGTEIPDVNQVMGYGPVRYIPPAEVRKVSEALDTFPIQEKAEAFDPTRAKAAKVYVPNHEPEELTQYFSDLRELYDLAAQNGEAVLTWIE
jgi:hypothetical protein